MAKVPKASEFGGLQTLGLCCHRMTVFTDVDLLYVTLLKLFVTAE